MTIKCYSSLTYTCTYPINRVLNTYPPHIITPLHSPLPIGFCRAWVKKRLFWQAVKKPFLAVLARSDEALPNCQKPQMPSIWTVIPAKIKPGQEIVGRNKPRSPVKWSTDLPTVFCILYSVLWLCRLTLTLLSAGWYLSARNTVTKSFTLKVSSFSLKFCRTSENNVRRPPQWWEPVGFRPSKTPPIIFGNVFLEFAMPNKVSQLDQSSLYRWMLSHVFEQRHQPQPQRDLIKFKFGSR